MKNGVESVRYERSAALKYVGWARASGKASVLAHSLAQPQPVRGRGGVRSRWLP